MTNPRISSVWRFVETHKEGTTEEGSCGAKVVLLTKKRSKMEVPSSTGTPRLVCQ